tara:strand:- start:176 stop:745 length:570 start_codon:yes stop_codon:yes gene_type:complete
MEPEDKTFKRTNQIFSIWNNKQKEFLTRRQLSGRTFAYAFQTGVIEKLPEKNPLGDNVMPYNLIIVAQKHKRLGNDQYTWIKKWKLVFNGFWTEDDPDDNKCKFFEYKDGKTTEKYYTYQIEESDCTINLFDNGQFITALRFFEKNFQEDILSWEQKKQAFILAQKSDIAAMQEVEEMDTDTFRVLLRM